MKHPDLNRNWYVVPLFFAGLFLALPASARSGASNVNPIATAVATVSYAIVDTGQTKCYNATTEIPCPATGAAFYGQDAQTAGQVPAYALSANGVLVSDTVTGLTWERSPDTTGDGVLTKADKLAYSNALAHCAAHSTANYQGYTDWRLPTIKELYSLIKFNGTDPSGYSGTDTAGLTPFIDIAYFNFAYGDTGNGERLIDSQYASSSVYVDPSTATKLFGVNFADGRIKGYDLTLPDGSTKTFFVQCVRGNAGYGVNAFVDNGDQTITDNATGLMWTKADNGAALNWQEALAWAQTKNTQNYLGHNDWRLPNAKELQSILDYTRSPSTTHSAAIDPIFNATSITNEDGQTDWPWYWASTTHANYLGMGAGVYLAFGRAGGWQKATPSATCYTFYDVHGAGAQRSDPKTSNGRLTIGPACKGGTAYGQGPQGDVQRGVNYVCLVRDSGASGSYKVYLPLIIRNDSTPTNPTPTPTRTATGTTTATATSTATATNTPTPTNTPTASSPTPAFTIDQTLSEGAQRNTIAFDGLAFLTGNLGSDSFFPPGKVADFWGFQYLRDNDPSQMGHNTDFLTKASLNMLTVLTSTQKAQLITLAKSQVADINQYGYNRFVLMTAFRRLLTGDLPAGSTGLDKTAVQAYSAELYRLDGEISYARAQVMGDILRNLNATQKAYLDAMVGKGMTSWPTVDEPAELRGLSQDEKVAVMTYAGDLFSWYAGSLEADVYFCPERQGTYFGSFYLKDAPAVGNPGYSIPVTLTADLGATFLQTLTPTQASLITALVNDQKTALLAIVAQREDVSMQLRQFISGGTPDQSTMLTLMGQYGELDGDIIYRYATAFTQVNQTLTAGQRAQLVKLRTDLLGTLAYPAGAYLYSQAITMPTVANTDFLFAAP